MPVTILDSINPFKTHQDVVAIFNENFEQVFLSARPVLTDIKEDAQYMTHPLETGEPITDHRVINPISASISIIFNSTDYSAGYNEVKQAFLDAMPLSFQTKVATYSNLYIEAIPHREDPDKYNTITMNMRLIEAKFVTAQFEDLPPKKVTDKKDSSTSKRGQQTGKEAAEVKKEKAQSILYGLFN